MIADKRIAVTKTTWETLSNLREPGQTFDQLLTEMIDLKQKDNLLRDLDSAEKGEFISLDEAKKSNWGLKDAKQR